MLNWTSPSLTIQCKSGLLKSDPLGFPASVVLGHFICYASMSTLVPLFMWWPSCSRQPCMKSRARMTSIRATQTVSLGFFLLANMHETQALLNPFPLLTPTCIIPIQVVCSVEKERSVKGMDLVECMPQGARKKWQHGSRRDIATKMCQYHVATMRPQPAAGPDWHRPSSAWPQVLIHAELLAKPVNRKRWGHDKMSC